MPTANYKYLSCFKAIFEYKVKFNIFYIWQRKEVERRREEEKIFFSSRKMRLKDATKPKKTWHIGGATKKRHCFV